MPPFQLKLRPTLLKRTTPRTLLTLTRPSISGSLFSRQNSSTTSTSVDNVSPGSSQEQSEIFTIRRERARHPDIVSFHRRGAANPAQDDTAVPIDVVNIYRSKIDELKLALDTLGPVEAFRVLRQLPSDIRVVGTEKVKNLRFFLFRLLAEVLHKGPKSPGMPSPHEIIKLSIKFGLRGDRLYDQLLMHMVSCEESPVTILPLFTKAVYHRIATGGDQSPSISREANPFFTAEQLKYTGRPLYVTYLYLYHKGFGQQGIMAELSQKLHELAPPDVEELLTKRLPEGDLRSELLRLAVELPLRGIANDYSALYARIRQTVERNSPSGLSKLYYASRTLNEPTEEYYRMFIRGFRQLWRAESAVRIIWNDMIAAGIKPTQKTYMALLPMAKDSKSYTILMDIWKEMLAAGIEPDVHFWTQRVDVAFHRNLEEGKMCLNEMIMDANVKPNNTTINVVLNHLINYKEFDLVTRMMEYCNQQGLQPDVAIYNLLLKNVVRNRPQRNIDAATHILKLMNATNVEPDNVTFTTLLESLRGFEGGSGEDLGLYIFNLMKDMGMKPRTWTYGALLSYLMSLRPRPHETIRSVFDDMLRNRVIPNSTIYDIVIRSAFMTDDTEAVEHYWDEMRMNKIQRDWRIWESMLLHYALRNDHARVWKLLNQLDWANKSMQDDRARIHLPLKAYNDIVDALDRRGSKVEAMAIIERVVNDWGYRLVTGPSGGPSVVRWWKTVGRTGGVDFTARMLERVDRDAKEKGELGNQSTSW